MTQDNWQDCPTMKSVVEAQERGDELMWARTTVEWHKWDVTLGWNPNWHFRCRPTKKTKTVVMREIEFTDEASNKQVVWVVGIPMFRFTGNERTEEVPYE